MKRLAILAALAIVLSACTPQPVAFTPTAPPPTIAPTPTALPPTVAPTPTPLPPTPEPTAVPTVAPTVEILPPTVGPNPTVSVTSFAALPGNIANGEPAPDFTVTTLTRETFILSEYRGSPVLLTFMAIGCPSCLYEITSLAETYPAYAGQGLMVLVVDVQGFDTAADLQPYVDSLPYPEVNWTIDAEFHVGQMYNVFDTGVTVLVDPMGRIVYQDDWPSGPEDFQRLLELAVP